VFASFSKKLTLFLFPAVLLTAAFQFLPYYAVWPPLWREIMHNSTYLVLACGLVLALHFNRSRAFFVFLLLLYFYWYSSPLLPGGGPFFSTLRLYDVLSFLLPVNITLFCLMREKGIMTPAGRKRFVFLAVQAVVILLVQKNGQADAQQALAAIATAAPRSWAFPVLAPPFVAICFITIAVNSYVRESLIDSGFLGVLTATAVVFSRAGEGDVRTVFLFTAGFILTLSILQDSHNMAYRDELTGLLSRRALNEQLEGLGRRYAVAMLDLDYFKRLNDKYGHDVGDQVLRMTAAKIRSVGGGGKAYRYGGEEFTIIFPGKRLEEALPHLENLRAEIASYRFRIRTTTRSGKGNGERRRGTAGSDETHVSVTISIGVAEGNRKFRNPRQVVTVADEALYRAKQKGRNRISLAAVS